jgi:transportin-3
MRTLDDLENLETMLNVVKSFGQDLPPACQDTCGEAWIVLEQLITKFGASPDIGEKVSRVLRHGISFFGDSALPVAPAVVARMSFAFEATGIPAYLWIAGKLIRQFGNEEGEEIRGSFQEVFERSTHKMVSLLQAKPPEALPDGKRAFLHLTRQAAILTKL